MLALAIATLTLVLTDVQTLPIDEAALQEATQAALSGSGVALDWDRAAVRTGRPVREGEARVILVGKHPAPRGTERVLGAVFRERRASLAIWLYVDEVRYVLEGPARSSRASATRNLSVALGRVLAHEVAHILAPGHPHAEAGLMARAVTRAVLGDAAAPLDDACLSAIRVATTPAGALVAAGSPGAPAGETLLAAPSPARFLEQGVGPMH